MSLSKESSIKNDPSSVLTIIDRLKKINTKQQIRITALENALNEAADKLEKAAPEWIMSVIEYKEIAKGEKE